MYLDMSGDLTVNRKATAVHAEDKTVSPDHEYFDMTLGMKSEVDQVQLGFQVSRQGDDVACLVLLALVQRNNVLIVHLFF